MPPRRSCFAYGRGRVGSDGAVSIPPRRSCFMVREIEEEPPVFRFNATTAFLLRFPDGMAWGRMPEFQCHHGVPASLNLNAWPPSGWKKFQCHHGVPASPSVHERGLLDWGPFNATTAFLLLSEILEFPQMKIHFQCHHGVPASDKEHRPHQAHEQISMPPRRSCFPSLLPRHRSSTALSMPLRRSCFRYDFAIPSSVWRVSMPPRRSCFFLSCLRPESASGVSMPPRRSCFECRNAFIL